MTRWSIFMFYDSVNLLGSTFPSNPNQLVLLQKRVILIASKNTVDAHADLIL